ncbi:MAG: NUDIX domain-containing protein, partial [Myxococcota bacterium]
PGGGIDPGEAPVRALLREVYEETGFDVVPERLVGVFSGLGFRHHYANGHEVEWTGIVFECRHVGGAFVPMDGEVAEHRYFDVAEAPGLFLDYPSDLLVPRDSPIVQELEQVVVTEAHRPEPPLRWPRGVVVTVLSQAEGSPDLVRVRADAEEGWVPQRLLDGAGDRRTLREGYDGTGLSTEVGQLLIVLRRDAGRAWCLGPDGTRGWVPASTLTRG